MRHSVMHLSERRFSASQLTVAALKHIGELRRRTVVQKSVFAALILALSIFLMTVADAAVAQSLGHRSEDSMTSSGIASGEGTLKIGVIQEDNIFTSEESLRFRVYSSDEQVKWLIQDSDGARIREGGLTINRDSGTGLLRISKQPVGFYRLIVSSSGRMRSAGFAVLEPSTEKEGPSSIFGVNSHGSSWEPELYQQAIDALKKIGVRHIREDNSYWDQVEKTPGLYSFPERSERVVEKAQSAGIDPLVLLAYGNRFYDNGETPNSDAAIEAAGKYAAAVVKHYGHAVPAVEVWNEYYGGFSTGVCKESPECYFRLLKSVYLHVKTVSPETLIVAPATFKVPVDWLSALFEQGALDYLDVVSVHPYRSPGRPEGLEADIKNVQSLIKKYNRGKSKPIWISEQGWSTQGGHPAGVDEQHQALYAVRSSVIAQSSGVERNYWYDLLNDGTDPNESEQNFGLLRRPDDNADGITPKPVYVAVGIAAHLLDGKNAIGACLKDKAIRCYQFKGAGDETRVMWSVSRPEIVTVRTNQAVVLRDVFGRRHTLHPVNGRVLVQLTESPVYLSGDGKISQFVSGGLQAPEMGAAVGQPIPLTFSAGNCNDEGNGELSGYSLSIEGVHYPVKGCTSTVMLPSQADAGERICSGELQIDGITNGYVAAQASVFANAASMHVSPSMTRRGDAFEEALEVRIENHGSRKAQRVERIEWAYGSQSGEMKVPTDVPPLSSTTITIPVESVALFRSATAKVTAHFANGEIDAVTNTFGFSPIVRATPHLEEGKFRGLEGVPEINLGIAGSYGAFGEYASKVIGPEQVSGKMWMSWDDTNLYIAARVLESNYVVQKNPRWLQAGDSIGIGLQPGDPGEGLGTWGGNWYNLYAGATAEGPAVFRESLPMDIPTTAHVQVERNPEEHLTFYLIALSWESLQPISPDHPLFSAVLTLNKNDGAGKPGYFSLGLKGWEEWGDGLNNFKLDRYGTVVLVR